MHKALVVYIPKQLAKDIKFVPPISFSCIHSTNPIFSLFCSCSLSFFFSLSVFVFLLSDATTSNVKRITFILPFLHLYCCCYGGKTSLECTLNIATTYYSTTSTKFRESKEKNRTVKIIKNAKSQCTLSFRKKHLVEHWGHGIHQTEYSVKSQAKKENGSVMFFIALCVLREGVVASTKKDKWQGTLQ